MPNGTVHMGTKEQHRTQPTKPTAAEARKTIAIPREDEKQQNTLGETTATVNSNSEKKKRKKD